MAPESSLWRMNEAMKSLRETLEGDAPPKSSSYTMRASRARSASCDLSSVLFLMTICLLVLGPAPWRALRGGWRLWASARVGGVGKTRMRWNFPKDRLRPFGKAFAALARKRPWASLRSQGGVGWGSMRRQLVGMGRCGRCGVWCACALERVVEVWCSQGRVDSAGRRRGCAGDARCTAVMPVKCAGCFAPWWRCSSVAWRPQCPFVIISGGGLV